MFREFVGDPKFNGKENHPDYDSAIIDRIFFEFEEEGEKILTDAVRREVLDFLTEIESWGLEPHIFFSGRRGFHILFYFEEIELKKANAVIKKVPGIFERDFELKHMCPVARHGTRQMRRIPNTKHQGSGLYCIPLSLSELSLRVEEILTLAEKPRGDVIFEKVHQRNFLIEKLLKEIESDLSQPRKYKRRLILSPKEIMDLPDCPAFKKALKGVPEGIRNEVLVGLISYMKNVKHMNKGRIFQALKDWRLRCENPNSFLKDEIYTSLNYHFNKRNKYYGCGMFKRAGLCKKEDCKILRER